MIKKVKMENLICSGCSSKIERDINKLAYVKEASYNITTQTMLVDFKDNEIDKEKTIKEMDKIVKTYESGVKVYFIGEVQDEKKSIINGYTIFFIGLILFGIYSFFYKNFYLFLVSYSLVGNMIINKSIRNIIKGSFIDENVLMLLATMAAIFIREYFEAILVIVFYTVGEYFQQLAVGKARKSINSLMDLKINYATLLIHGYPKMVEPESLKVGDIILVKQGEKIPVDGVVVRGDATLDTKSITGESKETSVGVGTNVISGCINISGVLEIKVEKEYADSTISKIIDLIENSTNKKTNTEKFISKFAKVYTPIVTLIAVLVFTIPVYVFKQDFDEYLYRACIFLVISCPCALVLSVPMAYFAGIGKSAKNGVLFKGSNYLDSISNVTNIFIDKTGTITTGEFKIKSFTSDECLKLAASIEQYSNHPIAMTITKAVDNKFNVTDVKEIPGHGISGLIDNKLCLVGNEKLMNLHSITGLSTSDNTVVYVAYNNEYIGVIELEDSIKDDTKIAIEEFKKKGINVCMLTGDNDSIAKHVASELSIDYKANLLPEDKVNILKNSNSGISMFIGDGINDGPVLAASDIAVSMGSVGSDIAIETSDVIIIDDNINKINNVIDTSKFTKKIVKQNIIFTLSIKLIFLVLGSLGMSSILLAIFADVGVALIAVLNSFRILRGK